MILIQVTDTINMNSINLIENILLFDNNSFIIGSYLLVKENILDISDINDIDLLVNEGLLHKYIKILNDNNYKETKETIFQKGYAPSWGSLFFEKEGEIPIHLSLTTRETKKYTIEELIGSKVLRHTSKDIKQISKIMKI